MKLGVDSTDAADYNNDIETANTRKCEMTNHEFLANLAAEHTMRFMEDATQATSRQIGFLAAIMSNNGIDQEEIKDAVNHYNGGNAWGLDRECASALISTYATASDLQERARKAKR